MYHQHESSYRHHGDCGCQYHGHHGTRDYWHHRWECGCEPHDIRQHNPHHGCCYPVHGYRHFPTKEEVIAQLEEYLNNLQAEAKGVEEHIAELRKNET